jgi:hypothetical protein
MADDYELLNLGGLTSLVANVKVSLWGNQIVFECIYDPTGDRSPYIAILNQLCNCCRGNPPVVAPRCWGRHRGTTPTNPHE